MCYAPVTKPGKWESDIECMLGCGVNGEEMIKMIPAIDDNITKLEITGG